MNKAIKPSPKQILHTAKSILLIDWPSTDLPYNLLKAGYTVFSYSPDKYSQAKLLQQEPLNTEGIAIFPITDGDERAYLSFEKVNCSLGNVDVVNVFRPENELPGIVEKHILFLGAKILWLHPPLRSELARGLAAQHCLEFVQGISIAEVAAEINSKNPDIMENENGPTLGNGKICYIEIPSIDINSSATFYKNVFGWKIRKRSSGRLAFDDGINEVSGTWVKGRKPSTEAGILVSIMVDSITDTVEKIIAHGCKVVKQVAISDHEMIAWFNDPAGNLLGLYQHPGGGNGKICYLEIPADDITRSASFYQATIGWTIRSDNHGNAAFDDGVGVVSGIWTTEYKSSPEPGLLVYVMMESVEQSVEAVIANGGKIVQHIDMDAPEITARFSDPFGNVLGLYQNPS